MPVRFAAPAVTIVRAAAPAIFAAAVAAGAAVTLITLLGTPAVNIGPDRSVSNDALSLYLGHGLFHDPAGGGYTPLLYTPLLTFLVAGLDNVHLWSGWPVLVSVLSTLSLAGLVAALALPRPAERSAGAVLAAAGLGGLAAWLAASVGGAIYFGSPDNLAWALSLSGLAIGSRSASPRAAVVGVVLLTLGFWAKQTTIAPAAAYGLWLVFLTARGRRRVRFTLSVLGALVTLNLIVLGVFALAVGRWEFYFNFSLPARQARVYGLHQTISDILTVVVPPAALALAMAFSAVPRSAGSLRVDLPRRLDGTRGALMLFAVLGIPFAAYFRSKQGGETNQYLGVVWALGGLTAMAWAASRGRGRAAADGLLALALLGALIGTASGSPRYDLRALRTRYAHSVPRDLRTLAGQGGIFSPAFTDLNRGQVYQDVFNAADLLASGEQPTSLVHALLERRFRYAETYAATLGATEAYFNVYASGYGAYEANYFWKLDQVIERGYGAARGRPAGVLERRPGQNSAAALEACFGPFRLGGVSWEIRRGGGFWCSAGRGAIRLDAAPAPISELVTESPCTLAGTVTITGRPGAAVQLLGPPGWAVSATRGRRGWQVSTVHGSAGAQRLATGSSTLRLDLGGGAGLPAPAGPGAARAAILATPGRGVTVSLGQLRLRSAG